MQLARALLGLEDVGLVDLGDFKVLLVLHADVINASEPRIDLINKIIYQYFLQIYQNYEIKFPFSQFPFWTYPFRPNIRPLPQGKSFLNWPLYRFPS